MANNGKKKRNPANRYRLDAVARDLEKVSAVQDELNTRLQRIEEMIPTLADTTRAELFVEAEHDLRTSIYELQDALADRDVPTREKNGYRLTVRRIRDIVQRTLPANAKIVVIGRPDRELLNIYGRHGFCLPQNLTGQYAGYNPATSTAVIVQLEFLRSKGAGYLLIPQPSLWWLEFYREFRQYLDCRYRLAANDPEACVIFDLREAPAATAKSHAVVKRVIEQFQHQYGRPPAILDWNTQLALSEEFSQDSIVSPPTADPVLPYLDNSFDLAVVSPTNPVFLEEAGRVAEAAIICIGAQVNVLWKPEKAGETAAVSIIIPVFNHIDTTEACLSALRETLRPEFNVEIIVVDDASTDATPRRLASIKKIEPRLKVVRNARNLGFAASCNRGARAASGEILVFLNNDTIPLDGWLAALLKTFRQFPDAGAVGGKMFYTDGRLQEAGGIVFSDGSAAHFGRDDYKAGQPLYNYVREVDYCSAACLATKKTLFKKLGGFDKRYSPAYYEDTDYCFKVRAADSRVYFQPECRIVHLEGRTAGTDPAGGAKQYQPVNQQKFFKRWKEVLKDHLPRPAVFDFKAHHTLAVRPALHRKRALFCALMPEYDRDSGSRRVLHLIEHLLKADWAITFVSRHPNPRPQYVKALEQMGIEVYSGDKQCMAELIETGDYDLAVFGLWDIAEPWIAAIRNSSPKTRVIVDSIDLHFLRNARRNFQEASRNGAAGSLDSHYASAMIRELNTYAAADAVLTVSEKEADLVNDLIAKAGAAYAVRDSEELALSSLPLAERTGIVFVGCFRHTPNADAVRYLCQDVLPLLKPELLSRHPVYIVGDGMNDLIHELGRHSRYFKWVGWVPSVDPY